MIIEILNWQKYNPRNDIKHPSWFRMEHSFFDNAEFYEFSPEQKLVWIYLLCQASKKSQPTVHLVMDHIVNTIWRPVTTTPDYVDHNVIHNAYHVRVMTVDHAIQKLKQFGMLKIRTLRGRYADVTHPCATYGRTDETDVTNDNTSGVDGVLDFDPEPEKPKAVRVQRPPTGGAIPVALYCDAYKNRYNHFPELGKKQRGILIKLFDDWGRAKFERIVTGYFNLPDAFVVQRSHPVELIDAKLNEIVRFLETGKVVTRAAATEFDTKVNETIGTKAEEKAQHRAEMEEIFARSQKRLK